MFTLTIVLFLYFSSENGMDGDVKRAGICHYLMGVGEGQGSVLAGVSRGGGSEVFQPQ